MLAYIDRRARYKIKFLFIFVHICIYAEGVSNICHTLLQPLSSVYAHSPLSPRENFTRVVYINTRGEGFRFILDRLFKYTINERLCYTWRYAIAYTRCSLIVPLMMFVFRIL